VEVKLLAVVQWIRLGMDQHCREWMHFVGIAMMEGERRR